MWVVDNGSSDGSPALVRERFPDVHLMEPEGNLGFGAAANLVARRTRAPWLVAANADVEITPGALERLLEAAEAHPEAGLAAPRLILPDGSTQPSIQPFPSARASLLRQSYAYLLHPHLGERLYLPGHWSPERPAAVPWAAGAFVLVRRDDFLSIGGFDESQWMYAEDLDLCWRLAKRGRRSLYEPTARVLHEDGAASAKAFMSGERNRRIVAAEYRWLARRRGVPVAWLTAAIEVLGFGARAVALSLLAQRSPRWAFRRDRARAAAHAHLAGLRPARELLREDQRPNSVESAVL